MNARALAWLAIVLLFVGSAWSLWQLQHTDQALRNRIAAEELGHTIRNQISALASTAHGIAAKPNAELDFERTRGELTDSATRIAVYDLPKGATGPTMRGWCTRDEEVVDGAMEAPIHLRVPPDLLRGSRGDAPSIRLRGGRFQAESVVTMMFADETGELSNLTDHSFVLPFGERRVWFSPGEDGPSVNVLEAVLLPRKRGDAGSRQLHRFVHASAPAQGLDAEHVLVRCDVANGELRADLMTIGDRSDDLETVLDPARCSWSFPLDQDDRPRVLLGGLGGGQPGALLLALWALGFACLGVAVWQFGRRATMQETEAALETSHELRTPLTVLQGELEVALRRDRSDREYRRTIETALAEVEGLQRLVTSLLVLGSKATQRHFESVDAGALVSERVVQLQSRHPEREFVLDVDDDVIVRGDPMLLERAIDNLLENAAVHSVAGGAIRIGVRRDGAGAEVSVADDGPGIPAARREQVFERFFRGPETGARRIPGAGLGLPVVRWIARVHGGDVTLDGSESGARFELRLPLG